jgi:hypothetical protein
MQKARNSNTYYNLGYKFEFGIGLPKNHCKAMQYYSRAAQDNHVQSICRLGLLYEKGVAGEQNKWMGEICFLSIIASLNDKKPGLFQLRTTHKWISIMKKYCKSPLNRKTTPEKRIEF